MSVQARQDIERKIVGKLVDDILRAGFRVAVSLERGYDVEDMLTGAADKAEIMEAAFAGDDCHLFVQPAKGPTVEDGKVISKGWVYLVFGNDGYDVISDYTVNLESLVKGANKLADTLEMEVK
jgi:hypothetical protein